MIEKILKIKLLKKTLIRYKHLIIPIASIVSLKSLRGKKELDKDLETVIIVSHEASRTGAPILALNICRNLNQKYNVVSVVLKDGDLVENFREETSTVLIPRYNFISYGTIKSALAKILGKKKPLYAIVNSAVAAQAIKPLRKCNIPIITLIHEFGTYIKPITQLDEINLWSNYKVFSSNLTKQDILDRRQTLDNNFIKVLPQGKCVLPKLEAEKDMGMSSRYKYDYVEEFLEDLKGEILILGAGQVQPRKGIDLFIRTASIIKNKLPNLPIKFLWIGSGYNPENDFTVSIWIEDQIKRSGLTSCLKLLEQSESYMCAMKRADIFLMTSRLDPLPNVAIDAMLEKVPLLCFEKATGIAEVLNQENELKNSLVAEYLDTDDMAEKAAVLINNEQIREQIALSVKKKAQKVFNMEKYVKELDAIGRESSIQQRQINNDYKFLLEHRNSRLLRNFSINHKTNDQIMEYLLSWKKNIWPKKPIGGFHPGIYKEKRMEKKITEDPYVNYIKNGQPEGPWKVKLIVPKTIQRESKSKLKIALHIHVHYPELLEEIIESVSHNTVHPDIFISINNENHRETIEKMFKKASINTKQIKVVPNRGRDLGALITSFGKLLDKEYDIHGHIHTKKSIKIGRRQADSWREYLLKNLLGTDRILMMDNIIDTFEKEQSVGIIFPDDPTCVGWTKNWEFAKALGHRLGINNLPKSLNFPVGSMFWARKGALTKLYELNLDWEDYPQEPLEYDGTILHAIERLLPIIAEKSGYEYRMTYIPELNR